MLVDGGWLGACGQTAQNVQFWMTQTKVSFVDGSSLYLIFKDVECHGGHFWWINNNPQLVELMQR